MIKRRFLGLGLVLGLLAAGCSDDSSSSNDPAVSPMADWNKVFVPYCTGDVYAGSITKTCERFWNRENMDTVDPIVPFMGEGLFVACTPNPADFDANACEAAVNPPAP